MAKISLKEYNFGMKHLRRFLKDNGYYADFCNVTLRYFSYSRHKHFDSIKNHTIPKENAFNTFYSFFSFTTTLGHGYKYYNNGNWIPLVDKMSSGWKQYCEDNHLEEQFNELKRRNKIKRIKIV